MDATRYLVDFDTTKLAAEQYDIIIIGGGIAGIYTALEIPEQYSIAMLVKESMDTSNSVLAQGGVAAPLDKDDSPRLHFRDTVYAGAGLCDEKSVWILVNEAADNINALCGFGVDFDRKDEKKFSFSKEGAHSKSRIVHAGDTTGKEICDKLINVARMRRNITIKEKNFAIDLLTVDNNCKGVLAYDGNRGSYIAYAAGAIVCAAGGFGQLYSNTTNPRVATGDGVAMAYRAGAKIMNMEFIQFHPTVLFHPQNRSFLISEAVRGEGALLKNIHGERFMPKYHRMAELAPRDVVSRSIFDEIKKTGSDCVYLDITFKSEDYIKSRFPNIYRVCKGYGIDISKNYIPVAPAEHYCMGGIKTDVWGCTDLNGFYACGEAACSGIHGANRLASNSLLEGLVFGHRVGQKIGESYFRKPRIGDMHIKVQTRKKAADIDVEKIRRDIREIMTKYVGIIRTGEGLRAAEQRINHYTKELGLIKNTCIEHFELRNMLLLSRLVIESAIERTESRGAHFRMDFQETDDINWKRNVIKKRV